MTNNHPDQIDKDIEALTLAILDAFGVHVPLNNTMLAQAHAAVKMLMLKARVDELKDVKPGKDSDLHHLSNIIDDRISNLEKEIEGMQPQEHES